MDSGYKFGTNLIIASNMLKYVLLLLFGNKVFKLITIILLKKFCCIFLGFIKLKTVGISILFGAYIVQNIFIYLNGCPSFVCGPSPGWSVGPRAGLRSGPKWSESSDLRPRWWSEEVRVSPPGELSLWFRSLPEWRDVELAPVFIPVRFVPGPRWLVGICGVILVGAVIGRGDVCCDWPR